MKQKTTAEIVASRRRRRRAMNWSMAIMLVLTLVLPLIGYVISDGPSAATAAEEQRTNPRADYWRQVRKGFTGYTAVEGQETNVLIQSGGEEYRAFRNGPVADIGAGLLALAVLGIGLFFIWRGRIKLDHGRAGLTVERWSLPERVMHWYTAVLFIILSITGLSLLYGRAVLIPLLGPAGFAAYAEFAKTFHNYLGPFFAVGVVLIIASWFKYNLPSKEDGEWFKQGGGIVGKGHPSAGRVNGGEKVWFWILCTVGVAVCVSGLILDFPNFGQTRGTMQFAQITHAVLALGWIAVFFGHVYIGTIGTEGALEGMTTGRVDVNWAKQHHDLWYDELRKKGVKPEPGDKGGRSKAKGDAVGRA